MIKYLTEQIVFQEIPTEISLAFEITNCPRRCQGCHTPELQTDCGEPLTTIVIDNICRKYMAYDGKLLFTCILFMGGEQHPELIDLLIHCRKKGVKTALYTGASNIELSVIKNIDFVKLGEYNKDMGALGEPTSNQALFKIEKLKV